MTWDEDNRERWRKALTENKLDSIKRVRVDYRKRTPDMPLRADWFHALAFVQEYNAARKLGYVPHYSRFPGESGRRTSWKLKPPRKKRQRGKQMAKGQKWKSQFRKKGPQATEGQLAADSGIVPKVSGRMSTNQGQRKISMREAGLNTTAPYASSSRDRHRNFLGEPISKTLPPGKRARGK